jgi:hypothetical protein
MCGWDFDQSQSAMTLVLLAWEDLASWRIQIYHEMRSDPIRKIKTGISGFPLGTDFIISLTLLSKSKLSYLYMYFDGSAWATQWRNPICIWIGAPFSPDMPTLIVDNICTRKYKFILTCKSMWHNVSKQPVCTPSIQCYILLLDKGQEDRIILQAEIIVSLPDRSASNSLSLRGASAITPAL